MMTCGENAGILAGCFGKGCCMFPDMENVIVSLVVRFIVVLLDPFVLQWWLFTDMRGRKRKYNRKIDYLHQKYFAWNRCFVSILFFLIYYSGFDDCGWFNTNMVSYYPGMKCVDKHRLQYQQSTRSTPKIRSPPTTPAMSIPNQKLFSPQYLKYFSIQYWFSQHFQSNLLHI